MRNLQEIFSDLQKSALQSEGASKHFEEIRAYLRRNDYPRLIRHLDSGIDQFKSSLFSFGLNTHQKLLLELREHLVITSDEDKEKRLLQLFNAIGSSEDALAKVREALNTGSAIVVNEPNATETPLLAALRSRNIEVIRLLLAKGAWISQMKDVNQPITAEGDTALHIACELGLNDLVVELISRNADVNAKRNDGTTPLHLASAFNQENIALLLLNKRADPNAILDSISEHTTAFTLAVTKKQPHLAQSMLHHGYKIRRRDLAQVKYLAEHDHQYRILYLEMKRPFVRKKKEIMFYSSTQDRLIKGKENRSAQYINDTLIEQMYFANAQQKKIILAGLETIYQHDNPILRPLLDVLNLTTAGFRNPSNSPKFQKPFKIIVSGEKNVYSLTAMEESTVGVYAQKNTAYVASRKTNEETLGTLLHELKHFVDQEIFGDTDTPFTEIHRDHFQLVKKDLQNSLTKLPTDTADNYKVYLSICSIFINYPEEKQDAEVLVKVPEIIGLLGVDKGYAWLEKNTPSLLRYYEFRFNKSCNAHIERIKEAYKLRPDNSADSSPTDFSKRQT